MRDIVFGFIRKVQCLFPSNNTYYNIVDLIKHIITMYYCVVIDSNLLKQDEIDDLLQLLEVNNKPIAHQQWQMIFNSKDDGIKRNDFVAIVHDQPNNKIKGQFNNWWIY